MYAIEKCEIGPKGFSFQNFGNLILKKKMIKTFNFNFGHLG